MNKKMNKIIEVVEKYGFEYLDEYENELTIEYTGDDLDYRDENDFSSKSEYHEFANQQGNIVCEHFMKAFIELNLKQLIIKNFYFDEYDYPCVILEL